MTDHTSFSRRLQLYEIAVAQAVKEIAAALVNSAIKSDNDASTTSPEPASAATRTPHDLFGIISITAATSRVEPPMTQEDWERKLDYITDLADEGYAATQPVETSSSQEECVTAPAAPLTPRKDVLLKRWEEDDIPIEGQRNQALEQLVMCEFELAAYQQAERELPERQDKELYYATERDYSALRTAAVALKVERDAWKMDAARYCTNSTFHQDAREKAEAELAESNAKYEAAATVTGNMMSEYAEMRDALAKTRNAGFKLTAALCALPEDDKEKISRPQAMELVVAWRAAIDAVKEQSK